jgi:hypothetical protein
VVSGVGNGAGGVKGDLLESCGDAATLLVSVGACLPPKKLRA